MFQRGRKGRLLVALLNDLQGCFVLELISRQYFLEGFSLFENVWGVACFFKDITHVLISTWYKTNAQIKQKVFHSKNKQNFFFFHQRHDLHKHSSFPAGAWKCSSLHEASVPSCKYRGTSNSCIHHLSRCLRADHTGSKPVLYFDFIFFPML